jgi:hypothetical protein
MPNSIQQQILHRERIPMTRAAVAILFFSWYTGG